jgi:hypothetical protein
MTRNITSLRVLVLLITLSFVASGCSEAFDDLFEYDLPNGDGGDDQAGAEDEAGDPSDDDVDPEPVGAVDPPPSNDPWETPAPTAAEPEPEPVPDVTATLNNARVRIFIVGGSMSVSVEADWSATGADDLLVDLEVLSSITYRSWTSLLVDQPASYFAEANLPATQGERRFDFRIVAHDSQGNEWISNSITVE